MTSTIGEQLKQARLKHGLTLVQASQSTHIRINYLEALENDQRGVLPSNVQGRGFLRLYAGLLKLPIEPLLAAWDGKTLVEEPDPEVNAGSSDAKHRDAPLPEAAPTEIHVPEAPAPEPDPEPALPPIKDPYVVRDGELVAELAPVPESEPEPEPTGSRLIFREIGEKLKQQREALGLSLVEIERYTRLRVHYIQALEAGRIDDLPSPVQGRGMLSNYAEFLNMDEETLLLRFAEGLQVRRVERLPKPDPQALIGGKKQRRPAQQAPLWRRVLTPDLLFGFGMAGIILFFVLWSSARYFSGSNQPAQPTPPGVSEILLTPSYQGTGTPPVDASPAAGNSAAGYSAAGNSAASTALAETAAVSGESTPGADGTTVPGETPLAELSGTPVAPLPVIPVGTPTLPAPPSGTDPVQVYVVAKQRAWLRVIADDKIKFLGRVVPGNAYTFSGSKRVELLTGSAGALQVFYNQEDMGVLGETGQVAGLVFVPAGIWTPTAAFTPTQAPVKITATPTQKPSLMATPSITPFVP